MGRIFLLLIVCGAIYGGYGLYQNLQDVTDSERLTAKARQLSGQDAEPTSSEPPAIPEPTPEQSVVHKPEHEPLPVVSSNHEWVQIEAWAILRVGGELPDGSRLESWDETAAVVVTLEGRRERRRFRRPMEVLSKLESDPVLAASQSTASPWSPGQQAEPK